MDKNKIIEAAAKLVAKGAYDKALKEYQKVLAADPKDARILQKLGELYQKKNDNAQAAQFFTKVAESYSEEGFFLKSVALYKQVLKLNPGLLEVNLRLAELHQQLQLMSEAASYYQLVASQYEQAGDVRGSLNIFKKLVDLSPENVTSRVKLAELYVREKMKTEAAEEFRRAIEYLQRHNRQDDVQRVMERLATLEPNNIQLACDLAKVYLALGDPKRALAKLQVCFNSDPKDVDTLGLLAQAFHEIGQTPKAISVYKELVKLFTEREQPAEANKIRNKIQQLEPNESSVANASSAGAPIAAESLSGLTSSESAEALWAKPARSSSPPEVVATDPFTRILTETDVYLKYGLHDRALEHLGKIFTVDPENLDAHEKALHIYEAANNTSQALEQLLNVLRLCARLGDAERGLPYLTKLLQQNPEHPEAPVFISVLGQPEEAIEPQEVADLSDDEILIESDEGDDLIAAIPGESDGEGVHDLALENLGSEEEELGLVSIGDQGPFVQELSADQPEEQTETPIWDEPLLHAFEEKPPAEHPGSEDLPDDEESLEVSVEEPVEFAFEDSVEASPELADDPIGGEEWAQPVTEVDSALEEDPASEEIAEAAFFLEQGLLEEARETLETVVIAYPGHPGAEELLAKLEEMEASRFSEDEIPEFVEPEADDSQPSAATSREEDFQYSAEDVFAEFKKGLAKVVQPHDVDTHYDLGIAYKEMDLVDDAIAEFNMAREACRDQKREIDCLTMISLLQQMKGDPLAATESLKLALGSQHVTPEIQRALEYDLGAAWEKAEEPGKALYHYQKCAALDPAHRDVAQVIVKLSAASLPEDDSGPAVREMRNGTRTGEEKDPASRGEGKEGGPESGRNPRSGAKRRKVGYM